MNLFVNDIPIRILKPHEDANASHFNFIVDAATSTVTPADLIHHVYVSNVNLEIFDVLLSLIDSKLPLALLSITLQVDDYEGVKNYLTNKYKVIKAAGGLVRKKSKFLMIYRLKKWDLPKGKKENKETIEEAAVREIEEECNIKVKLGPRICTTWHTYTMNKRAMLKKTRWYLMDLLDDSKMRPEITEDIEDLRWMNQKEVYHALEHSYKSIRYVFERYYKMGEEKPDEKSRN
ncbi:MAG TPA: NUDIX domain-containing protein [Cyclobacteriaceae bacterium]|nr:NUDIX domain-containing protein [Cyclobacteriaceae bacterium]